MNIQGAKNNHHKLALIIFFAGFLFFTSQPAPAQAKTKIPDWAAEKYSKITEITMSPGETKPIKVGFYNRGTYNWRSTGKNYVSLYTYKPKYHKSLFADKSWIEPDQPAKVKGSLTGPNSLGYFEFSLHAPQKTGVYKENFAIAAENKTWIPGGNFEIVITVTSTLLEETPIANTTIDENSTEEVTAQTAAPNHTAEELRAIRLSRVDQLVLTPNQTTDFAVMFLNKGSLTWQNRKIILDSISTKNSAPASFNPGGWIDEKTVLENNQDVLSTGRTDIYNIPLKAPSVSGIYTLHFILNVDNENVEGGSLDLPVTVVEATAGISTFSSQIVLPDQPNIRIGLFTTEEPLTITVSDVYQLEDSAGQNFSVINPSDEISLSYNESAGLYQAKINAGKFDSKLPLRLTTESPEGFFTITSHIRNPLWTSKINYNQFRGALELRLSKTNYVWAINELPIEDYLKGITEDEDNSPPEYLKALLTAARSYAYTEILNPTRHVAGGFTLDADYDQVYRGLLKEKASPRTVEAIEETRGMVVTYNGAPVFTPYFAQSNGKTKSAKQVWGSTKPWLVPITAKYDKGRKLWGHGVGMSEHDAMMRAQKENTPWDEILKYYYKGVQLEKMF